MLISKYHSKYSNVIRMKEPITAKELLRQIVIDYKVKSSEIEYGKKVFDTNSEVREFVKKLISNRINEENQRRRIYYEYYYRDRILRRMFPLAYKEFLEEWERQKFAEMVRSKPYDSNSSTYEEWMKKVESKEIFEIGIRRKKKEERDPLDEVLKGYADKLDS